MIDPLTAPKAWSNNALTDVSVGSELVAVGLAIRWPEAILANPRPPLTTAKLWSRAIPTLSCVPAMLPVIGAVGTNVVIPPPPPPPEVTQTGGELVVAQPIA